MKVVQVTDEDCKDLVRRLKLESLTKTHPVCADGISDIVVDQIRNDLHRSFHYHVVVWLQQHGAVLH